MANRIQRTHDLTGIDWTAIALTVVGAVNWGLVGLFRFDLVAAIFGPMSLLSRLIYIIVALAGVYLLVVALTRFRGVSHATTGPSSQAPTV